MRYVASSVSMTLKANFNNKITQHDLCVFGMFSSLGSMAALLIDLIFCVWGGNQVIEHLRIVDDTFGKARRCWTPLLSPDLSAIHPRNSCSSWPRLGVYIGAPWLRLGLVISGWTRMILGIYYSLQLEGIFIFMSISRQVLVAHLL